MESEKKKLATLVYYPEQKLELILKEESNINDWYKITLYRLIELCRHVSSKYTRSKVKKALPDDFKYVIEELLHERGEEEDKQKYYDRIIMTIIDIGRANEFIIALSKLIQRLVIDRLHILGDIYDRGPRPDIILDTLMNYHSVDIHWGNHDMLWMGAAAGVKTSIANVLRISARYSNLDVIEDIYGINLLPLATFALRYYENDPCKAFIPIKLTEEEEKLIEKLQSSFINSEKLQRHVSFLFAKGSMYLKYNSNLLFHGCIPLNKDKSFKSMTINGKKYKGKLLLEKFESLAREGYFNKSDKAKKQYGMDIMWYLWTGSLSSLFGKEEMATFERYFIKDERTHKEVKNSYYKFRDDEDMCRMIFEEFGLNPEESMIINGHVPVKNIKGESPIKANGKLLVIDGGFAKAYRADTGIAGYTLIYNSYGLQLVSNEPFASTEDAIVKETDILSTIMVVEKKLERKTVGDTDIGNDIKRQIEDLKLLLNAYRRGLINEVF